MAMPKIFAALLVLPFFIGCATSPGSGQGSGEGPGPISPRSRPFAVHGHRGARAARPENTLSAFRYALAEGVDTLEMDIHATKDNVLIITHDPAINPEICLDSEGKRVKSPPLVRTLTLQQVKGYDCGSLTHPRFPQQVAQARERIPTFEEMLVWLTHDPNPRAKIITLNVETKSEVAHPEFTPPPEIFTAKIIAMAKKYGVLDRMILQSFDYRTLRVAKRLEPTLVLSALVEERPNTTLNEIASEYGAQIISPNQDWLTRVDVESLHAIGVQVIPWTANHESDWRKLAEFGVDGIISDDPKSLLAWRARYFGH
jgi:glycerophosphoryl diester phosphodiesterase